MKTLNEDAFVNVPEDPELIADVDKVLEAFLENFEAELDMECFKARAELHSDYVTVDRESNWL